MTSEQTMPRVRNKPVIAIYDLSVLWFSNRFVWRCPTPLILDFYNRYISGTHLDAGIGTGYFLDHCTFPVAAPRLTLLDINETNLRRAAKRLERYHPRTCQANVIDPIPLQDARFDSIAINYVLHLLPAPMSLKARAFEQLTPFLNPGGVVFGSTILGTGVPHTTLAHRFLATYNAKGVFQNAEDSLVDLEHMLQAAFPTYTLETVGSVAFFTGRLDG
jgi:ubiquinone/menaquinone biosynthesis C-methylase UbiE